MIGFHWKREYEPLHNGINVYHPRDKRNRGFIVKLGALSLRVRWSMFRRCFFVSAEMQGGPAYGFTFPKPCHRFEAECDWMLMNSIRVTPVEAESAQ